MTSNLFKTAIKDGQYVSIDNFKPGDGEKCSCICPDCGERVRSNITAKDSAELKKQFTNHFSHVDENSKCSGGYKETLLHLYSKELLEKSSKLKVPSERYHYPNTLEYVEVKLEPAFPLEKYKQYRPDILLTTYDGENVAVEIFVTNDLSTEKIQLYRDSELRCLRIDLSQFYKSDLQTIKPKIKEAIFEHKETKNWVWPIVLNELDEKPNPVSKHKSSVESPGCLVLFIAVIFLILFYID